jgi:nucleoside-diphosphate-sugar epimerase
VLNIADEINSILELSPDIWSSFKNSRVFITGATGFFGKWLVASLLQADLKFNLNLKITVLTRDFKNIEKIPAKTVSLNVIQGDIRTCKFPEEKFDYIIHAASDVLATIKPLENLEVAYLGTKRLCEFAESSAVKCFLYISSGAVYNKTWNGNPESLNVASTYNIGKLLSESICCSGFWSYKIKIARCFAFVGPFLPFNIHFAIGNFIQNAILGQKIIIKGDGSPIRSFMYATDLVNWLITILISGNNLTSYDVGSDQGISIYELAKLVNSITGNKSGIEILGKVNTSHDIYLPDITKALAELNLSIHTYLELAIQKTVDWATKK